MSDSSNRKRESPRTVAAEGLIATFRHQFLWRVEHNEVREALKIVGSLLHRALYDSCQCGPYPNRSELIQKLEAVSADLVECAEDLQDIANDRRPGPQRREDRLGQQAEAWSKEAGRLARKIWNALSAVDPVAME